MEIKNKIFIGIDPGKKGGFAIIDNETIEVIPWEDSLFVEKINQLVPEACVCCLEKVGVHTGEGGLGAFSFGKAAGFIEGVLQANRIAYQLVIPQTWKKEFGLSGNKNKESSIEVCRKLFPAVSLFPTSRHKKPHDGMAESLLMAEYARRRMG